jgi:hypothetical protein
MSNRSDELLRQVASRSRMISIARWLYRGLICLSVIYGLGLVISRIFGVMDDWFTPVTVAVVPGAAVLVAVILQRGISKFDAARLVDVRMKTKDLYLTAAMIEGTPGEFQPLISDEAESGAVGIRAGTVVPFDPWTKASHVAVALCLVLVGAAWLPQFDPFGQQADRRVAAERIKKLHEEKLAANQRVKMLKSQDPKAKTSKEVGNALKELKNTFKQLKKDEQKQNFNKLNQQQKRISDQWKKANQKLMKKTDKDRMMQQLGGKDEGKLQKWREELSQGKTDGLQKQIDQIKQIASDMKNEKDEIKRNKMQQDMAKKVQELSDFTKGSTSNKELNEAISKALEQAQQSGDKQSAKEALDALKEQMNLTEQELEKLAQDIRDQKSLEDALRAIQQAKGANKKQDGVDGKQCQGCESLGDYQKLFEQLGGGQGQNGSQSGDTGNAGDGQGNGNKPGQGGIGGEGQGRGGIAPEVDQKATFKTEKVKQLIQAGKVLLEWKTQEKADPGTAKIDYKKQVEKVKQGVSEAILQEQIPPGYHDVIQKYFDSDGDDSSKTGKSPNPSAPQNSGEAEKPAK